MKITIDFDNETITDNNGTILVPGIKDKEQAVLQLLGVEQIPGDELRKDITELLQSLGANITI